MRRNKIVYITLIIHVNVKTHKIIKQNFQILYPWKKGGLGYLVNGPQHSKQAHAAQNTYVLYHHLPLVSVCHTQASPMVQEHLHEIEKNNTFNFTGSACNSWRERDEASAQTKCAHASVSVVCSGINALYLPLYSLRGRITLRVIG
jgi:hypothetical protein